MSVPGDHVYMPTGGASAAARRTRLPRAKAAVTRPSASSTVLHGIHVMSLNSRFIECFV